MSALWQRIPWWARSLIAFVLAFVTVMIVNYVASPPTRALFPGELGPGGLPLTVASQIVTQIALFAAGVVGGFVVVLLALRALSVHAWIFGGLALVIDLATVLGTWAEALLWFKVVMVGSVPAQVSVGARLAMVIRGRRQ
jgi:hypothetical protein